MRISGLAAMLDPPDVMPLMRRLRGYDARIVSDATAMNTGRETIVQQQFATEVDINTIVRRFGVTGERPSGDLSGVYGDFTGVNDYESAVAAVERAQKGFMALPAAVRERFRNDPGRLIDYAKDRDSAGFDQDNVDFGFVKKPDPVVPPVVPPVGP